MGRRSEPDWAVVGIGRIRALEWLLKKTMMGKASRRCVVHVKSIAFTIEST